MAEEKQEKQEKKAPTPEEFFDAIPTKEPIVVSICALAGYGKTHFANTFPNPVISDTEGRAAIVARKFPKNKLYIKHTKNMADVRNTVMMMATQLCPDPDRRHEWTWVLDSGSDWLQFAESEYLKEAKKDKVYPTVLWAQVYDKIDMVFDKIRELGFNAVITQQLKEEYKGEKPTGNMVPSGYKKFPYRVDVQIQLQKGIEYQGNIYYPDTVVGEVLKDCWHKSGENKPYIIDVSYDGIFKEIKPWVPTKTRDEAVLMILKELEEKTGIPMDKAKVQG